MKFFQHFSVKYLAVHLWQLFLFVTEQSLPSSLLSELQADMSEEDDISDDVLVQSAMALEQTEPDDELPDDVLLSAVVSTETCQ